MPRAAVFSSGGAWRGVLLQHPKKHKYSKLPPARQNVSQNTSYTLPDPCLKMPSPLSQRPIYTDAQLSTYLSLLFHPSHPFHELTVFKEKLSIDPIPTLTVLQRYHLGTIPWGDVGLHYSTPKFLSLDVQDIFEKIVVQTLGGYCMEVNTFYATILLSL
jgi:hypothetical protein